MRPAPNDRDIAEALRWITGAFRAAGVACQLVGGCAARAYGATRPLHDIDFYVPGGQLQSVLPHVQAHLTFGPERYEGERWRLVYLKARYRGMLVEVADAETTSFFDQKAQNWAKAEVDFAASVSRSVCGVDVPVMPREQLIAYKRRLNRRVDRQDIREMREANESTAV